MSDLSEPRVTYSFKDGSVDAIHEGKVVASGTDLAEVEGEAHVALASSDEQSEGRKVAARKTATHVTTPNGLKGTILGRTPDLWGERVTVRFANGHIAELHTAAAGLDFSTEVEGGNVSLERIASVVGLPASDDSEGLRKRREALVAVRPAAAKIASGLAHDDLVALDGYVATAAAEIDEIDEVLAAREAALEETVESYRPPEREYDRSWLDKVAAEEVEAARETPLEERVASFLSMLSDNMIADGSMTAEVVYNKFAGELDDEDLVTAAIEFAEETRQEENITRREARKQAHLASENQGSTPPDESLFL